MKLVTRKGTYYYTCMDRGRRVYKSLHTKDPTIAKVRYNKIHTKWLLGQPLVHQKVPINIIIDDYINTKRSPKHAYDQRKKLDMFLQYSGCRYISDITVAKYEDYCHHRITQGRKKNTLWHDYMALNVFLNWSVKRDYIERNPLFCVAAPAIDHEEAPFIETTTEISRLIKLCQNKKYAEIRDIVCIMLHTGIRAGTYRSLRGENFNWTNCTLRVGSQKGRGQMNMRIIRFDPTLKALIPQYKPSERLFKKANRPDNMPDKVFREAIREARIGKYFPPGHLWHVLRHTFASHYIMQPGRKITDLSYILGHTLEKTTKRYAHLSPDYISNMDTVSYM